MDILYRVQNLVKRKACYFTILSRQNEILIYGTFQSLIQILNDYKLFPSFEKNQRGISRYCLGDFQIGHRVQDNGGAHSQRITLKKIQLHNQRK